MTIRAFGQYFCGSTCWTELESRQAYVALIQPDGARLEMSLEAWRFARQRGIIEVAA